MYRYTGPVWTSPFSWGLSQDALTSMFGTKEIVITFGPHGSVDDADIVAIDGANRSMTFTAPLSSTVLPMIAGSVRLAADADCHRGPFLRVTEKEYWVLPARLATNVTTNSSCTRFQTADGEKTEEYCCS